MREAIMMGQNWLVTSASAKVDLVRRMKAAVNAGGNRLYAADADPLAAAFHVADGSTVLPPLQSDGFMEATVAVCREQGIGVILPTRDADIAYFSVQRDCLEAHGIRAIVSPAETVQICLDKLSFHTHCVRNGLPVLPRIEAVAAADFPCFVRNRVGAGGQGSREIMNAAHFRAYYGATPHSDLLIQPLVALPEFTIDILFDPDGTPVQWIARERLRVKRGESCVGQTVKLQALDDLVGALAQSMLCVGPITLQCFYTPETGPFVIEVNPRIAGGAALGIEAGLDTPARLVQLARGEAEAYARPRPLRYGLKMFRYSEDLFVG